MSELCSGPAIPMDPVEFCLLRDLIREHAGIHYSEENSFLLQRRLLPRLEALGLRSFRDYYHYLTDAALSEVERDRELDELCERLVTRETYFFRENYQLEVFRDTLLPLVHKVCQRGPRLTLWSAGCSTGEEPYTLAMLVLETGLFADWDVQVVGTDLSEMALQAARTGVYGPSSFRQADGYLVDRYFRELPGGQRAISEQVRQLVSFQRLNLRRRDWTVPGEPFDAIFCRNVLIYFDRGLRLPIIERFSEKLLPGGYLLLGHSESLIEMASPFKTCHMKRQIVYRKRGHS